MNIHLLSAGVAIASVSLYMLFMKLLPEKIDPLITLLIFYVTAIVCTLVSICFFPSDGISKKFSWYAVGAGVYIVGIKLGYLFMYRNGWELSAAPLVVMVGAAVMLTPIGILIFKQP